jgi:hypothetical protein
LNPNIWCPPCFHLERLPLRCHQGELDNVPRNQEMKLHHYQTPKPYHPRKPYQISPRVMRSKPSQRSKKLNCSMQPTSSTHPQEPSGQAKMLEALTQAKTMEVSHTSHLCGNRRQLKSSKSMQDPTNTKLRTGRRKFQRTKLQHRRSLPEFSKRLRDFVRNKRPSPEGRQRPNMPKQEVST